MLSGLLLTTGFATRKKGPMLYILVHGVIKKHEDKLGPLRSARVASSFARRGRCRWARGAPWRA